MPSMKSPVSTKKDRWLTACFLVVACIWWGISLRQAWLETQFVRESAEAGAKVIAVTKDGRGATIEFEGPGRRLTQHFLHSPSPQYTYRVAQHVQILYRQAPALEAKHDAVFFLWEKTIMSAVFGAMCFAIGVFTRMGKMVSGPLKQRKIFLGG